MTTTRDTPAVTQPQVSRGATAVGCAVLALVVVGLVGWLVVSIMSSQSDNIPAQQRDATQRVLDERHATVQSLMDSGCLPATWTTDQPFPSPPLRPGCPTG